jgi:hypothetical protein
MSKRVEVLNLYRRILRASSRWDRVEERAALKAEAMELFRKNRSLRDDQIDERLFEGTSRLELALHYKNAQPRLYHVQKGTDSDVESVEKFQKKNKAKYMASYDLD